MLIETVVKHKLHAVLASGLGGETSCCSGTTG